jgi:hypothetical protein
MRFLKSVKGYKRLDKIRSEVIRKELDISGIQDVRSKYKLNWTNHLERMGNTRLPKHALNYKPSGRRDRGRSRKRGQRVDAGTGQTTSSMEEYDDDDDDDELHVYISTRVLPTVRFDLNIHYKIFHHVTSNLPKISSPT